MTRSRAVVFLGPTLQLAEAKNRWPDADYRPPAQRGDVLRAVDEGAEFIGIVDGFFEAVPSVWHKEILHALEQRVHVAGSSSMGALRAAELAAFGMHGVGRVFEMVMSGEIEDDDVALVHAPAEFELRPFSLPLVNVRCSVAEAISNGVVDAGFGAALIAAQKRRFYPDRTQQTLAGDAITIDARVGSGFLDWYSAHALDQKQVDALLLLDHGRRWQRGKIADRPRPRLEWTTSFEAMVVEERGLGGDDSARPMWPEFDRLLAADPGLRHQVLAEAQQRSAARALARRRGFEPDQRNVDEASNRLRRRLDLHDLPALEAWLVASGLTLDGYWRLVEREAAVHTAVSAVPPDSRRGPAHTASVDVGDVLALRGFCEQ